MQSLRGNDSHLSDLQELKDTLRNLNASGIANIYRVQSDDTETRATVAAALAASGLSPRSAMDASSNEMAAPFGDTTTAVVHTDLDASLGYDKALTGTNAGAHSSKAVLSALRALQAKIRRLEGERDTLSHRCIKLNEKIKLVRCKNADNQQRC
jgi:hypothetical protein